MTNEAFALSPISARAADPIEAEYNAIRDAFMETARGRWFLDEYAKRNRNADTSLVLDAVARIEGALAAQRQPVIEDRLPEALAAIRRAVAEAETAASAAVGQAPLATSLEPVHRGVRIIKEISWRWREIGADARICDLIDSQLEAIQGACEQISTIDPRVELKTAFDLLKDQIEQADTTEVAAPQGATSPSPGQKATKADEEAEAATGLTKAIAEPAAVDSIEECPFDAAAEAEDNAVLEMVALEMAALDPEFEEAVTEPGEVATQVSNSEVSNFEVGSSEVSNSAVEPNAPAPEIVAAESSAGTEHQAVEAEQTALASPWSTPVSTILARGLLQKPWTTVDDPLEPIRRMTQAEKIAFFS